MPESPVLFGAPIVRAILDGRKTQTRRIVKPYRGRTGRNRHIWVWPPHAAECPNTQEATYA